MSKLTDYYGSNIFEGFDRLTISEEEKRILGSLRELSDESNYEYGASSGSDGFKGTFTSEKQDRVAIPGYVYSGDEIILYHSHTNNTCLSRDDLSLLLRPEIKKIVVVTPLGIVFCAMRGNGILPSQEEFDLFINKISDVNIKLLEHPDFYDWSETVRNYEALKEQAYQIARNFEWIIEGGML